MLELINRSVSMMLLVALVHLGVNGAAHANTQAGVDFLVGSQQADGRVVGGSTLASDFQSTAESLRALDFVIETHALNSAAADAFLAAQNDGSTESRSRILILAARAGTDTLSLLPGLLQHQNDDGGFGDHPETTSAVLDTAFALEAFGVSGFQSTAVSAAVAFLLNQQGANGAWKDGHNAPSVYLTALAMKALWYQRSVFAGVDSALADAQQFLLAQRNPATGLWNETHESALALLAIIPNVIELAEVEALIDNLNQLQSPDGSWNGDVYTTSLALRALNSRPTVPAPVVSTGSVSGRVVNTATGSPINDAQVTIGALSISVATLDDGSFSINDLDPGEYALNISAVGYLGAGFDRVEVSAGVNSSLGRVALSPLPTTGILQGLVSDRASGDPVAGALVRLTGANTLSIASTASGRFSVVGLNPGTVTIAVTAAGYAPVSANATISAGGTLLFNPVLLPLETNNEVDPDVPATGLVRGTVTDAAGGLPLPQAVVQVFDAVTNRALAYTSTDGNGAYQSVALDPGEIRIQIARPGYLTVEARARVYAGNAIVFSPGLVAEGADPTTGTGVDTGVEPLPGTADVASLGGVARDLQTSLPLPGVTISMSGAANASTTTGGDGRFSFTGLPSGEVEIAATIAGYLEVIARGTLVAGNNLVFDPEMIPEGFAGTTPGSIVGQVVEASSGDPLRFAVVTAADTNGEVSRSSGFDGRFQLPDLAPGDYSIRFDMQGYVSQTRQIVVTSGSAIDLGIIELDQALSQVSVFGAVKDSASGEPIANAVVSVLGSTLSTQTDAQGNYRLDNIGTGGKSLLVGATGYNSRTFLFNFPQNGEYRLDYDLDLSASTGLNITFIGTDRLEYPAYSPVEIQASVLNNGNPVQAQTVVSLFDSANRLVGEFTATEPGSSETDILFATGAITALETGFDTRNLEPGQYRLVARILAGNPLAGPATVILDERATGFSITDTRRVARLSAAAIPEISAVGTTEQVTVVVTALNRSNVDTSIRFRFRLVDPQGIVRVASPLTTLQLPRTDDTVIVELDPFEFAFDTAGDHRVDLVGAFGLGAEELVPGAVSVAPGLRIEPSQTLTPDAVTPDGNKRIRVDIRLEGMEVGR